MTADKAMHKFFENIGIRSSGMLHLSPRESYEICRKGAIIVDVREAYLTGFKQFDVKNVLYCPKSKLDQFYQDLPGNEALICADSSGLRSKEAVRFLQEKGFANIANMAGGIVEWERDGLPLQIDVKERLSGSCVCQLKKREKNK